MKFYFAPMEGITGYVFRNAYQKYFGGIDTYFTPFIASTGLNHKEKMTFFRPIMRRFMWCPRFSPIKRRIFW